MVLHPGDELSSSYPYGKQIAGWSLGRIPNHRAIPVAADDGVATGERGLRTERRQGGGAPLQRGSRRTEAGVHCRREAGRQTAVHCTAPIYVVPQTAGGSVQQEAGALAGLGKLSCRAKSIQSPALGGKLAAPLQHCPEGARSTAPRQVGHARGHFSAIRDNQLRRRGGSGGSHIRGEVGERYVNLVAHATHDRHRM